MGGFIPCSGSPESTIHHHTAHCGIRYDPCPPPINYTASFDIHNQLYRLLCLPKSTIHLTLPAEINYTANFGRRCDLSPLHTNYTTYCDTGVWSIYFGTEPQSVKKTIKLIYKELKKLREVKLGPLQLQKAKQQLIGQLAIAQENNCNLMQSIAKSYQAFEKVESIEDTNQKIMAITAEDIQEVAQEIFKEDQLSTIIYEPKDA